MDFTRKDSAWLEGLIQPFIVPSGSVVRIERDFDPKYRPESIRKRFAPELLSQTLAHLREYQGRLAAQGTHAVLVVLQGLDASGKDGTIRHVMSGVNPQGVHVHSFKEPSENQRSHDFLRHYQLCLPRRGEIGIFNRSHYEEVLVARVHPENLVKQNLPSECVDRDIWSRRFRAINDWERYLVENGVHMVKLFLNISHEEQRERFLKRCETPERNWKFSQKDVEERAYWNEYQAAISEMLAETSTAHAPWHVIPSDRKWFARIACAAAIVSTLRRLDPQFPALSSGGQALLSEARTALELPLVACDKDRQTTASQSLGSGNE